MRKKCLLLYKWPSYFTQFLVNKFSKFYDTEYLYISEIKNKNFSETVNVVNEFIKSKNIEIVFFDVDFIKFVNFSWIYVVFLITLTVTLLLLSQRRKLKYSRFY